MTNIPLVFFFLNKRYPHYGSTIKTGDDQLVLPCANPAILSITQIMMTRCTESPLEMRGDAGAGTHGNIPGNGHVTV
jgi:hypothetical protein